MSSRAGKNPTSKAMYLVVQKLNPFAGKPFDQDQTGGTNHGKAHCLGFYYATASKKWEGESTSLYTRDTLAFRNEGIDAMAFDLGFGGTASFKKWAMSSDVFWHTAFPTNRNPFHPDAFPEAKLLFDVLVHFGEVADRLKRLERLAQVAIEVKQRRARK